jgi:hypothetical protein
LPRAIARAWLGSQGDKNALLALAWARERVRLTLEELLARELGLKRNAVRVVAGRTSARKRVSIDGLAHDEIVRRLGRAAAQ